MSKRKKCSHCQYPVSTCVCEHIKQVECNLQISVMQDPKEVKHAKNTARLIPLILPQTEIFVGERASDFGVLQEKIELSSNPLLIYPCAHATHIAASDKTSESYIDHLILIDGTWRKAKKMYLSNPWLHNLRAGKLSINEMSQYRIRQQPFANSFSTIEALAFSLFELHKISPAPFAELLKAMQGHWKL